MTDEAQDGGIPPEELEAIEAQVLRALADCRRKAERLFGAEGLTDAGENADDENGAGGGDYGKTTGE